MLQFPDLCAHLEKEHNRKDNICICSFEHCGASFLDEEEFKSHMNVHLTLQCKFTLPDNSLWRFWQYEVHTASKWVEMNCTMHWDTQGKFTFCLSLHRMCWLHPLWCKMLILVTDVWLNEMGGGTSSPVKAAQHAFDSSSRQGEGPFIAVPSPPFCRFIIACLAFAQHTLESLPWTFSTETLCFYSVTITLNLSVIVIDINLIMNKL